MVHLTQTVKFAAKYYARSSSPRTPRKYRGFLDSIKLHVCGGAGGMGAPKYGGIGGKGGDVILLTKEGTLLQNIETQFRKKEVKASKGGDSGQTCIRGVPGEDKIVEVPPGLVIVDDNYQIIGELNEPKMQMLVARGGPGGCPETGFTGLRGGRQNVRLDLKLIADIGLVGFPNAGKSTLLKAITDAKPKIASYPFTTINPNVGSMLYEDLRNISVADLPGLIEGAHRNVGMGHQFLRHCERTKLLLLVVDIQGFQLSHRFDKRTCLETVVLLNKELELYREFLLYKPAILVVNKMDTEGAWDTFKSIEKSLHNLEEAVQNITEEFRPLIAMKFDEVIPISAKHNPQDVQKLKHTLRKLLDLYSEGKFKDAEKNLVDELQSKMLEVGPKYS